MSRTRDESDRRVRQKGKIEDDQQNTYLYQFIYLARALAELRNQQQRARKLARRTIEGPQRLQEEIQEVSKGSIEWAIKGYQGMPRDIAASK